jgi:signal transduction histidine kinase
VSNIPLSVVLFIAVPFLLGFVVRHRRLDKAAHTLATEALQREASAAVEAERRRIARELHDVVSHAVTLIAVQAEAGQSVLDTDPEATRRSLAAIGQVSREALAELGRLLAVLSEDETPAADAGLSQLGSLVEGARAAGLDVSLSEAGSPVPLGPDVDRCAYRVVQEGLTNALRHSSDARVRIVLEHEPDEVVVRVSSIGTPHASSYGGAGRGLSGLRERVAMLGGSFDAGQQDGAFEVRAVLPTSVRSAPA